MRDLLFRNLTSEDKRKKRIATCEIMDKEGVRSIIQRHLICVVKEIKHNEVVLPLTHLYVLKEHNNKEQRQRFFCKIKGSINATADGRLFHIFYMHSLKIILSAIPEESVE